VTTLVAPASRVETAASAGVAGNIATNRATAPAATKRFIISPQQDRYRILSSHSTGGACLTVDVPLYQLGALGSRIVRLRPPRMPRRGESSASLVQASSAFARAEPMTTLVDVAASDSTSRQGERRQDDMPRMPTLARIATWVVWCGGFVLLNYLFYYLSSHSYPGDSDKASTILEGQAVGAGHVLLHGWTLPLDSFWTLDQIYFAVATHIVGLRTGLMHAGSAFYGALIVVVAVAMSRDGRARSAALAGTIVCIALLVFPTPTMSWFFLGFGYHIDTLLYALLAFAALRKGRFGWSWGLGVALLTIGTLGDLLMVAYGVVPLVLAGLVAALRRRYWRAGVAPAAAAMASLLTAEAVHAIVNALGGFVVGAPLPTADLHQIFLNLRNLFSYGGELVGLAPQAVTGNVPLVLRYAHAAAGVCMLACLAAALWNLLSGAILGRPGRMARPGDAELWRLDDTLVFAAFGAATTFVVMSLSSAIGGVRYLVPAVLCMAILSGRMLSQAWPRIVGSWARRGFGAVAAMVLVSFAIGLGYELSPPAPVNAAVGLTTWLEAHHLDRGVGDYWAANITTVVSGGAVTVRPVVTTHAGTIQSAVNQASSSWYSDQQFQFLVYDTPIWDDVDSLSATRTWGRPAHMYMVGTYRVLVWSHSISVDPQAIAG
jgi:hypothetical protein